MAVTTQYSTQYNNAYIAAPQVLNETSSMHGRMRLAYFTCTQVGVGDATSSFALFKLPAGRVRLILPLSYAYINWVTGSATMDIGWDAYTGNDGVAVVADPDGIIDGLDVDAIGFRNFVGNATGALNTNFTVAGPEAQGGTLLLSNNGGVTIRATSQDVALANGDTMAGFFTYVID